MFCFEQTREVTGVNMTGDDENVVTDRNHGSYNEFNANISN